MESDDEVLMDFSGILLHLYKYYNFKYHIDIGRSLPQESTPTTPVKKASKGITSSSSPVNVDVLVNFTKYKKKTYVVSVSGLCFDTLLTDDTMSSHDVVDGFAADYESFYKCILPIPKDINYRKLFLNKAGFDTEENLALLSYLRHISYNPVVGDIDVATFKLDGTAVNRRFPFYFVHINNVHNSNADEHSLDLGTKVHLLLASLKKMQFKFTSKGPLSGRRVNYIYHETEVDVTEHVESREYKQMRLLLACCHSIKEKEKNKRPENLTVKEDKEISVVPLTSIVRSEVSIESTETETKEDLTGVSSTPPKRNSSSTNDVPIKKGKKN